MNERFIAIAQGRNEAMRRVVLPMSVPMIERELDAYLLWYDEYLHAVRV